MNGKICQQCKETYYRPKGRSLFNFLNSKFCQDKCREIARRDPTFGTTKICEKCSVVYPKPVSCSPKEFLASKYCGLPCFYTSRRKELWTKREPKKCKRKKCSNKIYQGKMSPGEFDGRKYCSLPCRNKENKKKPWKTYVCCMCAERFTPLLYKKNGVKDLRERLFCGPDCKLEAQRKGLYFTKEITPWQLMHLELSEVKKLKTLLNSVTQKISEISC